MKEINTKWGKIYIEDYEFDRHKPYQREEEGRIKLFDSDQRYLDYYNADMTREEYDDIIDGIENAEEIDDFLYEYIFYGNKEDTLKWIKETYGEDDNEIFINQNGEPTNEFINRIGETYLVHECFF